MIEKARKESSVHQLSYGQKALYFMYLNAPESSAYNVGFTARILSAIDLTAFRKALQKLINRHPSLRTNYFSKDGIPMQEVHGYKEAFLEVTDVSGLNEKDLKEKITEVNRRPFDLEGGDIVRVHLFRVSEENTVLLINIHHIANDGFSMAIMLEELKLIYESETDGTQIILPVIQNKYTDYIKLQEDFVKSNKGLQQWEYWESELSGELPVLNLPVDKSRPALQTYNGDVEYFSLEEELVSKLKVISREEGTTLFVILLSAYEIFLHLYTGQDEITVGTPTAGRNQTEFEKTTGYFINPVAIRTDFKENTSLRDFVIQVKKKVMGAITNQEFPFALIVEKLHQKRDPSRSSVFQTFFGLQSIRGTDGIQEIIVPGNAGARVKWGKLILETYETTQQEGQFELTLEFTEGKNLFTGAFKYNTDLFEKDTVRNFIIHFKNLLLSIVEDKSREKNISELEIFSSEEKQKILFDWNDTAFEFKDITTLQKLIEIQTLKTPEGTAVIFEGDSITYDELNRHSNRLANYLISQNVKPDTLIGIFMERSIEMVIAILGILKSGAAYIPVDPEYPESRVEFMIKDSAAEIIITQNILKDKLPENISTKIETDNYKNLFKEESETNPEVNSGMENLAYVIYTSGSTGMPKGVMISQASIVNHMLWMKEEFKPDINDSVLQKTPFSFDASVWEFYFPLITGGRLIIAKPEGHMDTPYLVDTIIKNKITTLQLVPTLLQMLLNEKGIADCKSLKNVFCGGETLTYELQEKLFEKLDVNFYNLYGPTEATIDATYYKCEKEYRGKSLPIGKPVYNATAYILNKYMKPVPAGVSGELYLGGINIARGYLYNPELTDQKFTEDIFVKGGGRKLYRTGDFAKYLSDGNIEFAGRADHQVKLRGFRIELEEIESVIREDSNVRDAVVIVREDKPGVQRLSSYIVFKDNGRKDISVLKDSLRKRLPVYMIPADIVILESIPLTPNMKVDRSALPIPEQTIIGNSEITLPTNRAEEILLKIWKDVLRIDSAGINDNFFELGGDSIISIQIISRANQAGMKISPKQIFQFQTVSELASVIEFKEKENNNQDNVTGEYPLTAVQEWFFAQELPEPDFYNHSVLLKLPKGLNENYLKTVFNKIYLHHDALRTKFNYKSTRPVQCIDSESKDISEIFSVIIIKENDALEIEADIHKLQKSTDIEKGNLIRARLYRTTDTEEDRLFITVHHLVTDGISWRILLEDLYYGYDKLSKGEELIFQSKTNSYKDWCNRLTKYSETGIKEDEKNYWLRLSEEYTDKLVTDISADIRQNTADSADTITAELSSELTQLLLKEVHKTYNTRINDLLLASLYLAYTKWKGGNKLLINLEGHGREELFETADVSRTVGWFTSIFPVILKTTNQEDIGQTIKDIKENLRNIPNSGTGFGILYYLTNDHKYKKMLEAISRPDIIFNYLGQMNNRIDAGANWNIGSRSIVLSQSREGIRDSLIEINSQITEDGLKINFIFSNNFFRKESIESFANLYTDSLEKIIAHCTNTESGGYTPSDFSAADLSQQEIDNLLENLN